jgi:hypothetical protein
MALSKPKYAIGERANVPMEDAASFFDDEINGYLKKAATSINQNARNGEVKRVVMMLIITASGKTTKKESKLKAWAHPLTGRGMGRDCADNGFYLADTTNSASPAKALRRCGIAVASEGIWAASISMLQNDLPTMKYRALKLHYRALGWNLETGLRFKTAPVVAKSPTNNVATAVIADGDRKPAAKADGTKEEVAKTNGDGDEVFDMMTRVLGLDEGKKRAFLVEQLSRLEGISKKPHTDG